MQGLVGPRAHSRRVHQQLAFRMGVDSQTNLFFLKVVDLVQVAKQQVTNNELTTTLALQPVLVDRKLALGTVRDLEEVELRRKLEDVATNLETDWSEELLGSFAFL